MSTAIESCARLIAVQLGAQAVVEVAVVVEAGQGVGLRLELEARADLRVVERECSRVAEALREVELLLGEDASSPRR
jgi:hypothetical protein